MSTSPDTIIYILDQLENIGTRIRTLKMFGEYALYCDEKVVGLICDDQLLIKITDPGIQLLGKDFKQGIPYPGAKPMILVGGEVIEDREALSKLIEITAISLPIPKPKKIKKIKEAR